MKTKKLRNIKTSGSIYLLGVLLWFVSCHKETTGIFDNTQAATSQDAALKFKLTTKKKSLKTVEHTKRAGLVPRYGHTSLVFDDKMWVLAGKGEEAIPKNDIQYSANGTDWQVATSSAPFPARYDHASTVFNGKMWVVGGKMYDPEDHDQQYPEDHDHSLYDDAYSELNDVWSSSDGVNWVQVTANADFEPRNGHTLTAFNGFLWLIGGTSNDQSYAICCGFRDVWKSSNGSDWVRVTGSAPFNLRASHTTVATDDMLVLIGGELKGGYWEIWYSINGADWNKALEDPPFGHRNGHSLLHDGSHLWLIAGHGAVNEDHYLGTDVWYSKNGLDWIEAGTMEQFPGRTNHSSVFFNNRLWVLNGQGIPKKGEVLYSVLSDIWSLQDPDCCVIDDITIE
ncbi:hypothetical protein FK220_013165 [Flavobacteriaceae bacterium TP-CH-4]|uniref:Galactose oxidase n=1 Tax=Pelagihabitans pacificus TaxID=2696054 RepID=A0A967AZ96_9FLAO|nr:hypothetical protein [Pelagihabitans pacificus]NHF60297.1 hypothetical protein [Pelagihabitans pacificus]